MFIILQQYCNIISMHHYIDFENAAITKVENMHKFPELRLLIVEHCTVLTIKTQPDC